MEMLKVLVVLTPVIAITAIIVWQRYGKKCKK